jgi:hypothetical protein
MKGREKKKGHASIVQNKSVVTIKAEHDPVDEESTPHRRLCAAPVH